jgi:beta-1,4-mannosyltransferase
MRVSTFRLVGYTGEDLIPDLVGHERLTVVRFTATSPQFLRGVLPIYFVARVLSLLWGLIGALWWHVSRPVDCVLVQNPPAIPLLLVTYIYRQLMGLGQTKPPKLIIDWHNLGYSMFREGTIRKLARLYERTMAPLADGHLCVTKAMKDFLKRDMCIVKDIDVLYDCPPTMFRPLYGGGATACFCCNFKESR